MDKNKHTNLEEQITVDKPTSVSKAYQFHDLWQLMKQQYKGINALTNIYIDQIVGKMKFTYN